MIILSVDKPIFDHRYNVAVEGFIPVKSQLAGAARLSGVDGITGLMLNFGYFVGTGILFPLGPLVFPIFDTMTTFSWLRK
jgi:hypothetical protein